MYASFGRPSIAPEKLLRALLLQVFYTVRSERMLMEQLEYNLDADIWDRCLSIPSIHPATTCHPR
jgi:transposase